MQAIIMAGGEGIRLRPLTSDIPKPLAPLCQKPVLMYILDLLRKYSFKKATLTLMYKADKIIDEFDEGIYKDIDLNFSVEKEPLGTAGCVKLACTDSEVLVISGDAMCDFDLAQAVKFHREKNADATIVVKKVTDPREFGLVLFDSDNRIKGFIEKPSYENCTTDMANTGVYILSKKAIDLIENGKKLDFAADIFPLMLKSNMMLYAYEDNGYWCDIGDFNSYKKCQKDMLEGVVSCNVEGCKRQNGVYSKSSILNYNGVKFIPPVYIGENVRIGIGSIIEAGTVLSDNVTIGENARIHSCIILDNAFIGDRVSCTGSVICKNTKILRESRIEDNAVIGENAVVGENSTVSQNVKVWQNKSIDRNFNAVCDIKFGNGKSLYLDDEGICGETNGSVSCMTAMMLGSSIATGTEENIVALGYSSGDVSRAMSVAFSSGTVSAGSDVWDFGICSQPELDYCMFISKITSGCYIEGGEITKMRALSQYGLPPTRKQERKIEAGLNRGEYASVNAVDFGKIKNTENIKQLYEKSLSDILPVKFNGFYANVKCDDENITSLMDRIISVRNDYDGMKITVNLTNGARLATFYSEDTGYVFYGKLVILCCKIFFEYGKDVSLPYHFPRVAENVAQKYNRKVMRYYNCSCDESDKEARSHACESRFVRDGMYLCCLVLGYLSEKGITLKEALCDIPQFYTTAKYVSISKSPSQVLKNICSCKNGFSEGVAIDDDRGRVLIRPVKAGKGVMMFVESFKSEMAGELCQSYEKLIKENEDSI